MEQLTNETAKKGTELIKREQVGNSPLVVVTVQDKGVATVLGQRRLTEWFKTREKMDEWIKENNWEFISTLIGAMMEEWDDFKEQIKPETVNEKIGKKKNLKN